MNKFIFILITTLFLSSCRKEAAFQYRMLEYFYISNGDTISTLFVPNSFTPNWDGINDQFIPVIDGFIQNTYSLHIYDKNNVLILNSFQPQYGWDGMGRGIIMSNGLYLFTIKYTATDSTIHSFENELMLMR